MKKLLASAAALVVSGSFVVPAAASGYYGVVKTCLQQVCVTSDGVQSCLKEGVQFRNGASANPDVVEVVHVQLAAGIREHPLWQERVTEIEACLSLVPGMQFTGRTDN